MTRPKSDQPIMVASRWRARKRDARKRRIVLACGTLTLACEAIVFGEWAAHESPHLFGRDRWRVTHVPSGCDIAPAADGLSRRLAIKVAQELGRNMPRLPHRTLQREPPKPPASLVYIAQAIIAEALSEPTSVRLAGDRALRSTR